MRTFLPNEDTGLKKSSNFPKFTLSFEERKQDSEHNLPSPALLPTLPEAIHKSSQAGLLPKFLSPPGKTSHSYCKILFWISDALFSKVWSDHYRLTRESPPLPPDMFRGILISLAVIHEDSAMTKQNGGIWSSPNMPNPLPCLLHSAVFLLPGTLPSSCMTHTSYMTKFKKTERRKKWKNPNQQSFHLSLEISLTHFASMRVPFSVFLRHSCGIFYAYHHYTSRVCLTEQWDSGKQYICLLSLLLCIYWMGC